MSPRAPRSSISLQAAVLAVLTTAGVASAQPAPEQPEAAPSPDRASSAFRPELSLIGSTAASAFTNGEALQPGLNEPSTNGPQLLFLELGAKQTVDRWFELAAFLLFRPPRVVELEEVYGAAHLPAGLEVRAGLILTRFGRINATHPHDWELLDLPFPITRIFGGAQNRNPGLEVSWRAPLPWELELVLSGTTAEGEDRARSFFGASEARVDSMLDLQYVLAVKQAHALSRRWGVRWGLSGTTGPNPTGRTQVFGGDVLFTYSPFDAESPPVLRIQGEVFYRRRQVPEDALHDWNGYTETTWRFARGWDLAGRWEGGGPGIGKAGRVGPDPLDLFWTSWRNRVSTQLAFWPSERARLRLQGAVDLAPWLSETNWSAMLGLELAVGAHGRR